ncbi:ead/Ea22-like family protein, partial [Klebsiella pneumoniae]
PRAEFIALANPANILALVEALEKAQQAPSMPLGLHPDTQKLVAGFCTALAEKLYKAQLKYGYDADWKQDGWPSQCQAHFQQHIAKGDPRDVAAYCAFMWWHGWSTKPAEGVEPRTVTVKLPDYRNTYKSPFADEVEHQVRLALELFSSAAGIKVEAE